MRLASLTRKGVRPRLRWIYHLPEAKGHRCSSLVRELHKRKQVMDQLEEENEFLKERAEEMRNEYEVNLEELKKENAFLRQEKENLRKTIDFEAKLQREELNEVKADAEKLQQMRSEYISLLAKSEGEAEMIKDLQDTLHEKMRDARNLMTALYREETKVKAQKKEIDQLNEKIKQLTEAMKRTMRQKEDADERLMSLFKAPSVLKRTGSISSVTTAKSSDLADKLGDRQINMMGADGDDVDSFVKSLEIGETGSRKKSGTRVPNEDDGQPSAKGLSWTQAEKAVKGIKWPGFDGTVTIDTVRRMFQFQIDSARNRSIPDDMIKDSIVQHLMSSKRMAEFANLTQEVPPSSLENVIEIIHKLDPEEQCLAPEERFKAMTMSQNETSIGFIKRLQTAFRDMFGKNVVGDNRRIRTQFIEAYEKDGLKLTRDEKKSLFVCQDLTDLAIAADRAMERIKANKNDAKRQNFNQFTTMPQAPARNFQNFTPNQQGYAPRPFNQNKQYNPKPFQPNYNGQRSQAPQNIQQVNTTQANNVIDNNSTQNAINVFQTQRRTTAGPNAARMTLEDLRNGKTANGDVVCFNCAQSGHLKFQCAFYAFCVYCNGEKRHNTASHVRWSQGELMGQQQQQQQNDQSINQVNFPAQNQQLPNNPE